VQPSSTFGAMRVLTLTAWLASLLALCACAKTECPHDSVFVPAGTFEMGMRKPAWGVWQLEPRKVTLTKSYCMDRTEVTYRAYETCQERKGCTPPRTSGKVPPSMHEWPKAFADWADAQRFCSWCMQAAHRSRVGVRRALPRRTALPVG
jgi:formylglycine-generating enzyme required for sulfatase activity